jgi:membrane protein YdbS with pleckstrin-like domain
LKKEGSRKVEEGTQPDSPSMRLLRLWLWLAPLVMLALAVLFGVVAVREGEWGLLAAMVVLALVAVGLFVVQWRLLRRLRRT